MAKLGDILKELVEAEAARHNAFVTGHSSGAHGLFRYYIDSEDVLSMNTIAEITRNVSARIDETDTGEEPFTFEISSPGADNPLTDIRQFGKHTGRTFKIETADSEMEGKLLGVSNNIITIEETITEKTGGKKHTYTKITEIPFDKITTATIKISFK